MLDLKHALHSINLTKESKQCTSCCASSRSPSYQYSKLSQGLNVSPAYFTSLMNDLLQHLSSDICEYIDCIMDDVIIFTPDIKTHKYVIKSFMLMLKKYCMLLTIKKIHTFRSKVKYMGLLLSSKDNLLTTTPLGSRVKPILTLAIPITARGIKSLIGCVIYLGQFLPKLSQLIKPINDILRKCNKVKLSDKIGPLLTYAKGKGKGEKRSPDIQKNWMSIQTTNFEAIKELIVQAPVLHLPARSGCFYLECDSSIKHIGSVLYQIQNGTKHVIAFYSATMLDAATSGPNPKASVLRDPPAIMARKRSTALPPIDLSHTAPKKREHGCPPLKRTVQPAPPISDTDDNIVEDMNETLPTLFSVRRQRRQAMPVAQLPIIQPDALLPYNDDEIALKQIHTHNLQDNVDLTCRTAPARPPTHNNIPQVIEDLQPVNMDTKRSSIKSLTS